ncbi:MAG TPA: type IV pilin-like G/H family protein [Coleofasciculaceae cyanobacterium]
MNQFLLANAIVSTFLVLGRPKALYIFIGIILVELLALWLFFKKAVKVQLSFPKLLLISVTANVVSALLGVFFPYAAFNLPDLSGNLITLGLAFLGSCLIEWGIYIPLIRFKTTGTKVRLKSAIIANLSSYLILLFYIVYISIVSPELSQFHIPEFEVMANIESILKGQKAFYLDNSRFTSSFKELNNIETKFLIPTNTQAEGFYYIYQLSADQQKAQVTVKAKQLTYKSKPLSSYTAIILSQPRFIYGICKTAQPSTIPPATPQIVKGEIQCPPGSSLWAVTYNELP